MNFILSRFLICSIFVYDAYIVCIVSIVILDLQFNFSFLYQVVLCVRPYNTYR